MGHCLMIIQLIMCPLDNLCYHLQIISVIYKPFIYLFSCLCAMARTSRIMLNRKRQNILAFFPILGRKPWVYNLHPFEELPCYSQFTEIILSWMCCTLSNVLWLYDSFSLTCSCGGLHWFSNVDPAQLYIPEINST